MDVNDSEELERLIDEVGGLRHDVRAIENQLISIILEKDGVNHEIRSIKSEIREVKFEISDEMKNEIINIKSKITKLGGTILIVFLAALLWVNFYYLRSNIKTLHPVTCNNGLLNSKSYTLKKLTFKTSFDQQHVIKTVKGEIPERLSNCTVKDVENWSCSSTYMKDGNLYPPYESQCLVSWWRYELIKFLE